MISKLTRLLWVTGVAGLGGDVAADGAPRGLWLWQRLGRRRWGPHRNPPPDVRQDHQVSPPPPPTTTTTTTTRTNNYDDDDSDEDSDGSNDNDNDNNNDDNDDDLFSQ